MEIAARVVVEGKELKNENLNQIMDSKEIAAGKTQLLKLAMRINAQVGLSFYNYAKNIASIAKPQIIRQI